MVDQGHRSPHSPPAARAKLCLLAALLALASPIRGAPDPETRPPAEKVSFSREIRPILSDRCFKCHGPDGNARKKNLRFDVPDGQLEARANGTFIIKAGAPEESELYQRIASEKPSRRMPPAASNLSLKPEEIALIRRWIEEGAPFEKHWSFIPVGEVPVPATRDAAAVKNPIDAFVIERLEAEGLKPSPEASREALIRRASFDLTGLPPSIEEIDAFLADASPDAYEKVIDRLLASPAYGEKRAGEWLDLARFADTHGYQADVERDMSPWRDWVIRAFNENLPMDRFLTWQLAGDLLPSPSRDQRLATAFNRLHRQTNEGGSVEEEFRVEYAVDRVNTFGTAVLGLPIECARCHDHKFDPIPQKDYYRLFSFFDQIDESGLYSHFTLATPTPTLLLYAGGDEERHGALRRRIRDAEDGLAELRAAAHGGFEEWRKAPLPGISMPAPSAAFAFDRIEGDKTPNSARPDRPGSLSDGPVGVEGKIGRAIQFSGDNSLSLGGSGEFNRTSPFSFTLWLKPGEKQDRAVVFHRSRSWTDSGSRGYELLLENGKPSFALVHFWPGNAVRVKARSALPIGAWTHLAITYDGSSRAAGILLYQDGEPLAVDVVRDHLTKDILHLREWGDMEVGGIQLTLAGRFRDSGFKGGAIDEFNVFDRRLTAAEVRLAAGLPTLPAAEGPEREALFEHFLERVDGPYQEALAALRKLREDENRLIDAVPEIMVMREISPRRPTHLLKRGAYDAPGEEVEPGAPERILPYSPDLPRTRLGLARWVTDRKNPLTARVIVNRAWKAHFGRGLVATVEDFGSQGQAPSHPRLLDFLAGNFMDHGWDLKALHRLIALSATYRQMTRADPALLERDPENRLLARGPKHRFDAEEIRDAALAVSGLLVRKVGGRSVKPYQPEGLWEEAGTGKSYTQDHGEALYRRSIYTFRRRTAPPPSLLAFDATSREVCTARRERTTTPLQALVLLDDPQFVEAARVLAEGLVREFPGDADGRITRAFRLATGRRPDDREREVLRRLLDEQRTLFAADPPAAEALKKIGERPPDGSLPAAEVAATSILASCIMNLDEFVTKR
jgi:uncharacterized protein DUF1553/uncharacterized protein DUF1549/concanavalin A-like lectin/glucanase superfamily protein/cytochrome c